MSVDTRHHILVAGTGPVGLISALAFAEAGFGVVLAGPPARADDGRTTALMVPALKFLARLGVLESIEADAAPLKVMRIIDGTSRLIRSPIVTFRASEIGEEHFGLNFQNRVFNAVLERTVEAHPAIEWRRAMVDNWALGQNSAIAALSDGTTVEATLAVAADGRNSPARQAAGISASAHSLPQAALVLNFAHSRDHAFTSTEFHTETGPFTQVPLPGRRSSLVWVLRPETAEEFASLDDDALSPRVEQQMQSMLGRVTVEGGRQIYPLSTSLPQRFAQNRVALVGEAAHVFPPIGAQGLNLGIRDVDQLVEIASKHRDDAGSAEALAAYDSARRPDILARTSAVNLLNRSLLSDMLPAQLARSAGLNVLGGFSPLRAFFMREGLRPGSGFSSVFAGLRSPRRTHEASTD
ncbi:2-octaprenyl-3-methyl-6-methoxy-1,4-benzoquinol hydroxylase [Aminobacter aminovorans]|uniref:2-octaprenyl-6-methoxyphenol hydroxylase n=1 Tax=Aminobacter aminovorans TaxID=83263 RepID=A0A380WLW9_AMIAI|nr:UbiH/UbiF family hydroxylase [Aminobacter aminovorans]TCS27717.1 2-octaprenyl-3-methyl-6-methoxy-1,4-benzoquinol hydroxylase [Aminobacter aminovorans]SUU89870.1 2-octaprenyl-6-methoxyphenol hydroxylase [Aminobacter aminovorans]